ncbi:MAG: VOC family protein [Pseudomonadota bacterium]
MKLRQVAIAARHLEPIRTKLFDLFGIQQDFKDPGVGEFGLENSVMAIGNSFFEIVAPVQENTAAGRTLDRAGSDACGYMLLFQVNNFAQFDAHLDSQGLRKVWNSEQAAVSACHVHPKDMQGAIVSFDEMRPPESWLWGGPSWEQQQATDAVSIRGCALGTQTPQALAQHWSSILQTPVTDDPAEGIRINFADGTFVAFEEAKVTTPQLTSMTINAANPDQMRARSVELGLGDIPTLGTFEIHIEST